ncbi:p21-activated kinase-interacting protein-like [Raphidocelis subcapitata]|uniref:p21-activated kinase-interacting protein-like n=1 Tax=Raphidocelis subcapitata TaxID=307507 RepID=A0A2V0NPM0_9CHLO|nr:p21-activated kinase-interacting protein-like [Raphidocelis subcapitata]|eukprot:GBF89556.1 p21-activated kinase-interacting protein-like [Raphidocelis subcapitata]
MQLVVATYERFLLGYDVPADLEAGAPLPRAFTHASHQGPVRAVDAAGPFVVTGGSDDQLHIYDAKRGRDLGFLMNPGEGAVPCLQLYTPPGAAAPSHLFSGSADGGIAVWRAGGEWEHLKLMKGHRGAVNALALHPSGRLALSVAHDRQLRMWDLLRGRCTYTAGLDAEGLDLRFGPSGGCYALLTHHTLTLHAAAGDGGLLARVDSPEVKFTAIGRGMRDDRVLLVGQEDGGLAVWDARAGGGAALAARVDKAHGARIRAIVALTPDEGEALPNQIATASSDGAVRIWDCRALASGGACRRLGGVETRARITGMALSAPGRRQPALAGEAAAGEARAEGGKRAKQRKAAGGGGAEKEEGRPERAADGSGGQRRERAAQQQQAQKKPQQRQQQHEEEKEEEGERQQAKPTPKPKPKPKAQKKQQQQRPGVAAGDEALVPRVTTIIRKKRRKAGSDDEDGGGFGGEEFAGGGLGGSGGGGFGGVRVANKKAARRGRGGR